ncbi:hypothetical protein [Spirobacillus cienkowskii]|jgi:hypothetical protein|uniref:Uncharacterized protein n=1 Tax=Spirobacillus cienkowskii TaxID=495820 RepID=A0A369KYB2_9BACT|nr:MAG: hypothetical protein DCC88_03670 [Spirobacillus cienkowskii]
MKYKITLAMFILIAFEVGRLTSSTIKYNSADRVLKVDEQHSSINKNEVHTMRTHFQENAQVTKFKLTEQFQDGTSRVIEHDYFSNQQNNYNTEDFVKFENFYSLHNQKQEVISQQNKFEVDIYSYYSFMLLDLSISNFNNNSMLIGGRMSYQKFKNLWIFLSIEHNPIQQVNFGKIGIFYRIAF